MRYFNGTGTMHNRLRMIVSSYLTKIFCINWKKVKKYFASKLLHYEASSNIGSWQWAASRGAMQCHILYILTPLRSAKFDKHAIHQISNLRI